MKDRKILIALGAIAVSVWVVLIGSQVWDRFYPYHVIDEDTFKITIESVNVKPGDIVWYTVHAHKLIDRTGVVSRAFVGEDTSYIPTFPDLIGHARPGKISKTTYILFPKYLGGTPVKKQRYKLRITFDYAINQYQGKVYRVDSDWFEVK